MLYSTRSVGVIYTARGNITCLNDLTPMFVWTSYKLHIFGQLLYCDTRSFWITYTVKGSIFCVLMTWPPIFVWKLVWNTYFRTVKSLLLPPSPGQRLIQGVIVQVHIVFRSQVGDNQFRFVTYLSSNVSLCLNDLA